VDNRLLNLTMTVSSSDSARVKTGQTVEFSVDALPGKMFSGKVMYINPELSSSDRSLKVVAEVRNVPETLKSGLFAKGRIITGRRSAVLQVPRSAITGLDMATRTGNLYIVEQGVARRRTMTAEAINGELVAVAEGVKPGEQYVVRGGFNLKDGDKVVAAAVK
jgi:RND family efflux transporter MFP subunit